jgi:hypothetical protein
MFCEKAKVWSVRSLNLAVAQNVSLGKQLQVQKCPDKAPGHHRGISQVSLPSTSVLSSILIELS